MRRMIHVREMYLIGILAYTRARKRGKRGILDADQIPLRLYGCGQCGSEKRMLCVVPSAWIAAAAWAPNLEFNARD